MRRRHSRHGVKPASVFVHWASRTSLPRSFINDNERDGEIIRSQSLSSGLFLSHYHHLCVSLALLSQYLFLSLFSLFRFRIYSFHPHLHSLSFSTFCLSSTSSQTWDAWLEDNRISVVFMSSQPCSDGVSVSCLHLWYAVISMLLSNVGIDIRKRANAQILFRCYTGKLIWNF